MTKCKLAVVFLLGSLSAAPASSQSNDIAAERSRVANERIRVEAERIAQEEKRKAEAAAIDAQRLPALDADQVTPQTAVEQQNVEPPKADVAIAGVKSSATAPQSVGQTDRLGMSRMLEHLRVLGQLRDSGYVTEAEFERIKKRILDGEL